MLFNDKPIQEQGSDLLGRSPVAHKLAEGIKAYKEDASLVIGIQGKWGDGKTSFLNMIVEQDKSSSTYFDPSEFIIVQFNPWYFSGDDQILKQFCGLISERISSLPDATDALKDAAKLIKRISAIVKPIQPVLDIGGSFLGLPLAGTVANNILKNANSFANDLEQAFQPTEDIIKIKEKISKELKKFGRKILVVIDDIDRLNESEIYEIFKLVKIIADFPNTIYLLSYDKKRVQFALGNKGHDKNFIDKIVQHEFDIPAIDEQSFFNFLDEGISSICTNYDIPVTVDDRTYYGRLILAGLRNPIRNLREVKRILNKLNFDYGCLKGEVHIIDLLAITILKLHCGEVVDYIERHGQKYLGGGIDYDNNVTYADFKEQIIKNNLWAIKVLEVIFPVLKAKINTKSFVPQKMLCTEEHFKKYFQLAVPSGRISDAQYFEFIRWENEHERMLALLLTYKALGKDKAFIAGIRDRLGLFKTESISNLITALLNFSDVAEGLSKGVFGQTISELSFMTAFQVIIDAEKSTHPQIISEVMQKCKKGKCALIRFVDVIGRENGYFEGIDPVEILPDKKRYLSKDQFDKTKMICIELIDRSDMPPAPDLDLIMSSPNMVHMMDALKRWEYLNLPTFRARLLGVKNGVLRMMRHYVANVSSTSKGEYLKMQVEEIRSFMDENISVEKIISDAEIQMRQCDDEKLIGEIREAIKNIKENIREI